MASAHVSGWEGSAAGEPAHAVERASADGPPPWTAVCGAEVALARGAWTPGQGPRAGAACPECLRRTADR